MEADTILWRLTVRGRYPEPAEHPLNFLPTKQLTRPHKAVSVSREVTSGYAKTFKCDFASEFEILNFREDDLSGLENGFQGYAGTDGPHYGTGTRSFSSSNQTSMSCALS